MNGKLSTEKLLKYIRYAVCLLSLILLAVWFAVSEARVSGDGYKLKIVDNLVTGIKIDKDVTVNVQIPEGVIGIRAEAFFGKKQIVSVKLPSSVEYIAYHAFVNCEALERVEFAENSRLTEIGVSAFHGCISLREIKLPRSVEKISFGAFGGCTALKKVTLSERLVSIGTSAFEGCVSLETVTIPKNVRMLGQECFSGCTALSGFNFEEANGWRLVNMEYINARDILDLFSYVGSVEETEKTDEYGIATATTVQESGFYGASVYSEIPLNADEVCIRAKALFEARDPYYYMKRYDG